MKKFQQMKKNEMGIGIYKCPWSDQYVCNQGYSFYKDGRRLGRIVWLRSNELNGIYVDKDELETS